MTADNLTFALEIDFIPDLQEGRDDFKKKMKSVAEKIDGSYTLDQKSRPIISGLTKEDIEKVLTELGLLAFGMWPSCILTCSVTTALPMRAVGMSDGWDIYTGKKTFFAFAQFPADALSIMVKACTYYLDHENYQSLEEFIDSMGYEAFRDTVLGNTMSDMNGNENYYGSSWGMPNVPPLNEGDFVRPEHNIMQVIEVYPEMGQFLMEYGMSCVGCFVSYDENLWQAAQTHGMENTHMEEILTLYPQLLPLFQNEKIQMPSEMATPIGELCKEANVDFTSFIQKCDARLRGDENNL